MAEQVAVLERELLAQRERYNTLFALARRMRPRLDGERFLENLRSLVGPIVEEQGARLVEPLYDLCLELSGSELFLRSPAVRQVWAELLPGAASRLLAGEAPKLVASLTNAAYNVETEGADWKSWLEQMTRLESRCDSPRQWLELGQVAAWTSGLAHYRESALKIASNPLCGPQSWRVQWLWGDLSAAALGGPRGPRALRCGGRGARVVALLRRVRSHSQGRRRPRD